MRCKGSLSVITLSAIFVLGPFQAAHADKSFVDTAWKEAGGREGDTAWESVSGGELVISSTEKLPFCSICVGGFLEFGEIVYDSDLQADLRKWLHKFDKSYKSVETALAPVIPGELDISFTAPSRNPRLARTSEPTEKKFYTDDPVVPCGAFAKLVKNAGVHAEEAAQPANQADVALLDFHFRKEPLDFGKVDFRLINERGYCKMGELELDPDQQSGLQKWLEAGGGYRKCTDVVFDGQVMAGKGCR